jgi:ketosteroid isomerase-like protein
MGLSFSFFFPQPFTQFYLYPPAIGHCVNTERNGEKTNLKFRLTMGFRKHEGRWRIVHEHHSLPAID